MCRIREKRIRNVRTALRQHEGFHGPQVFGRIIRRSQPQADEVEARPGTQPQQGSSSSINISVIILQLNV
jgi:hypothetical protein